MPFGKDLDSGARYEAASDGVRPPPANAATSLEVSRDGHRLGVLPAGSGTPEFRSGTEVFYVNGIATDYERARGDAQLFANSIHDKVTLIHAATQGQLADMFTYNQEKLIPDLAYGHLPEQAVAAALMAHVHGPRGQEIFEGDVHFGAHSRGAIIVQRGIELFEKELVQRGMSEASIASMLNGRISAETFGGASSQMPSFVSSVHYVNENDDVGMQLGEGRPSLRSTITAIGTTSVLGPSGVLVDGALQAKNLWQHPQGPVIVEPGRGFDLNPESSLVEGHNAEKYIQERQPFQKTYDQWVREQHPADVIMPTTPRAGPGNHIAPEQSSLPPNGSDIQARVDLLRERGVRLPDVRTVIDFQDRPQTGSFVALSSDWVAQHCGAGVYQRCNVNENLHGVTPPEGMLVDRGRSGTILALSQNQPDGNLQARSNEPNALGR